MILPLIPDSIVFVLVILATMYLFMHLDWLDRRKDQ